MKQHITVKIKMKKSRINIYLIGKFLFGIMGDAFQNMSFVWKTSFVTNLL